MTGMKTIRYFSGYLLLKVFGRKLTREEFDAGISFIVSLAWILPLTNSELKELHGRLARLECAADEFISRKRELSVYDL